MGALRSLLAVVVGMAAITITVEGLEYALVILVHGGATSDAALYFSIRNGPAFLAGKLLYNTAAAALGGYLAARIAGSHPFGHGTALAILQTLGFMYALATPPIRETGPLWMWLALIPLTVLGIVLGTRRCVRRMSLRTTAHSKGPVLPSQPESD